MGQVEQRRGPSQGTTTEPPSQTNEHGHSTGRTKWPDWEKFLLLNDNSDLNIGNYYKFQFSLAWSLKLVTFPDSIDLSSVVLVISAITFNQIVLEASSKSLTISHKYSPKPVSTVALKLSLVSDPEGIHLRQVLEV